MNLLRRALPLLAACLLGSPAFGGNPIDGATIEYEWPYTSGSFERIEPFHFSSDLEYDCAVLYDSKVFLAHHPGRFELTYVLVQSATDIAVAPIGGNIDCLLFVDSGGLKKLVWDPSAQNGIFESPSTLSSGWVDVTKLWAFPWGSGTRLFGYEPGNSLVRWADFDGSNLGSGGTITSVSDLDDLAAIEWTSASGYSGPELAWLESSLLMVTKGDGSGSPLYQSSLSGTTFMGVSHAASAKDLLVWLTEDGSGDWTLRAEPTSGNFSMDLESDDRSCLVVADIDKPGAGNGQDDVVLPLANGLAAGLVFQRVGDVFQAFPGGKNVLTVTDTEGTSTQTVPVVVATAADFDNDGTKDLFLCQGTGSTSTASQYLCRPEYEERYRPIIEADTNPDVHYDTPTTGLVTIDFPVTNPNYEQAVDYFVQAFVLNWASSLLDTEPLDETFIPMSTSGPNQTSIEVVFEESRLPEDYAIFFMVTQVNQTSEVISQRWPTRIGFWSPDPGIEEDLGNLPYPPDTDPLLDNGIISANRLGARVGSTNLEFGPPPP